MIQHSIFCYNKYLFIENQMQEEEAVRKVFKVARVVNTKLDFKD